MFQKMESGNAPHPHSERSLGNQYSLMHMNLDDVCSLKLLAVNPALFADFEHLRCYFI